MRQIGFGFLDRCLFDRFLLDREQRGHVTRFRQRVGQRIEVGRLRLIAIGDRTFRCLDNPPWLIRAL